MISFKKRVRSAETETRHFNNLKTAIQDPKTKINSSVKNGETIFTLESDDGRVHRLNYSVDAPGRRRITLSPKIATPEPGMYKKRTFQSSRSAV